MFCPSCKSEYRPGFTHCAGCDVALVDELPAADHQPSPKPAGPRPRTGPLIDFCGFFTVEEAREARDRLRREGIRSEIAIREAPDSDLHEPLREEYWVRFAPSDFGAASRTLGFDEGQSSETLSCSACGQKVATEEVFCPHCGARFEGRA